MEMQQLRYLEAAVRLGSFAAASAACFVSQPALSIQIKNLEDELGVKLLRRLPRGVEATAAGEHVAQVSRRVLRELSQLGRELRRRDLMPGPVLRLGVQPFIASEILPRMVRHLPKGLGRLSVRERAYPRLLDALLGEEVDLVIMAGANRIPAGLVSRPLFVLHYGLFCGARHPLASRKRVTLSDLLKYEVVLFQDASHLEPRLMDRAAELDVSLNIVFSGDHGISAFEMISEGLGVGLLPLCFAHRAKRRKLKVLPLAEPSLCLEVVALYREDADLSPMAEFFFSQLPKEAEPVPEGNLSGSRLA